MSLATLKRVTKDQKIKQMSYLHLGEVHRLVADVVSLSLHRSVVLDGVKESPCNILKTSFSLIITRKAGAAPKFVGVSCILTICIPADSKYKKASGYFLHITKYIYATPICTLSS